MYENSNKNNIKSKSKKYRKDKYLTLIIPFVTIIIISLLLLCHKLDPYNPKILTVKPKSMEYKRYYTCINNKNITNIVCIIITILNTIIILASIYLSKESKKQYKSTIFAASYLSNKDKKNSLNKTEILHTYYALLGKKLIKINKIYI